MAIIDDGYPDFLDSESKISVLQVANSDSVIERRCVLKFQVFSKIATTYQCLEGKRE